MSLPRFGWHDQAPDIVVARLDKRYDGVDTNIDGLGVRATYQNVIRVDQVLLKLALLLAAGAWCSPEERSPRLLPVRISAMALRLAYSGRLARLPLWHTAGVMLGIAGVRGHGGCGRVDPRQVCPMTRNCFPRKRHAGGIRKYRRVSVRDAGSLLLNE
jgi:hypothetical protein